MLMISAVICWKSLGSRSSQLASPRITLLEHAVISFQPQAFAQVIKDMS
jgi:hypothetical protein